MENLANFVSLHVYQRIIPSWFIQMISTFFELLRAQHSINFVLFYLLYLFNGAISHETKTPLLKKSIDSIVNLYTK